MGNNEEIELKLRVMDKSCWPELRAFIESMEGVVGIEHVELAANYFDTEDGALRREKIAYRVRAENGRWVAALKGGGSSDGGLHRRAEWNVPAASGSPDLRVFACTGADLSALHGVSRQSLEAVVRTEFRREAVTIALGQSRVEAALDAGRILAGGKEAPILELELELKTGCAAELLHLGAVLAKRYPLIVERRSKYLRGLMLRETAARRTVKRIGGASSLKPIHDLLDVMYDAWAEGMAVDRAAYAEKLSAFTKAFSPRILDPSLIAWPDTLKQGHYNDIKNSIYVLLRTWANKISNM